MSYPTRFHNQCFAFVGLAQASALVHSTANGRDPDPTAYSGLYRALILQDPDQVSDLTSVGDFQSGQLAARGMLGRPDEDQVQTLRYALAVIDASNRLRRFPRVVERLAAGIAELPTPTDSSQPGESRTCSNTPGPADLPRTPEPIPTWDMPWERIAELYVDTLGSLDSRIQVTGNASILQRPDVASKIRSLLLMGVRFAWLWRQLGGRRWHLLTHRNRIRSTIDSLEF